MANRATVLLKLNLSSPVILENDGKILIYF